MHIWPARILSAAALAGGLAFGVYAAGPALGAGPVTPLAVAAQPIALNPRDPGQDRVGRLRYVGGLELKADNMRFGGISGLLWEPGCKRLLAVTDSGSWLILEPAETGERLTGLTAGWIAPLLAPDGQEPALKSDGDAEELARAADGAILVFYEQAHRVARFPGVSACAPESLARAPAEERRFGWTAGWPGNGGMEAATTRGPDMLVIAESVAAADGGRQGVVQPPDGAARRFTWANPDDHEPTAADLLAGAGGADSLLVLHRRFSPLTGVSAILSAAALPAGKPGAPDTDMPARLEGEVLARLAPPLNLDNMEGLAVRTEGGRQYVYLVSDNNFNAVQRTLLMKFELLPE